MRSTHIDKDIDFLHTSSLDIVVIEKKEEEEEQVSQRKKKRWSSQSDYIIYSIEKYTSKYEIFCRTNLSLDKRNPIYLGQKHQELKEDM